MGCSGQTAVNRGCVRSLYANIAPDASVFIISNNQYTPFPHQSKHDNEFLKYYLLIANIHLIKIIDKNLLLSTQNTKVITRIKYATY